MVNGTEFGKIKKSDVDESLTALGLLVGLIEESSSDEIGVRTDWLNDPLGELKKSLTQGNDRLFEIIDQSFAKDVFEGGEDWYPIDPNYIVADKKPSLCLVRKVTKASNGAVTADLVGLGCRGEVKSSSVVVRPYLFVPIAANGEFVAGESGHPIAVGVEFRKSGEKLGTKAVKFSGLKFSSRIRFDAAPEISDIMLSGLELDGVTWPGFATGTAPAEVGLIALFQGAPDHLKEWIVFIVQVILKEIGQDSLAAALNNLLLLLGLSGGIPEIDWGKLASAPDQALRQWIAKIFSNDASRKTWLNAFQCLLNGKDCTKPENADAIRGKGTAAEPYTLSVLSSWAGSSFDVTFATDDTTKALSVGLRLESETYELAHGIGVQFLAAVDTGQFQLSKNKINKAEVLRAFDLSVRICHPEASSRNPRPLFRYTPYPQFPPLPGEPETAPPPNTALILGALQAGVKVSLSGDVQTPVPSLLLTGITLGEDKFDVNLLTLKKTPKGAAKTEEGATEPLSKDNVRKLLEVMGAALQDVWNRYQPSRYASLATNVERIIRGDDYKAIIDKLLTLSGKKVSDIPALLVEFGEWIAKTNVNDVPKQAFQWLIGKGNVFGLLGGLLSLKIPEFSGTGSLLAFTPWRDFSVAIGKDTDRFGIWLRPRAEVETLSLSGEAAVTLDANLGNPVVTASARIGLADASLDTLKKAGFDVNPELAVTLGENASSFSVEFYPLGSADKDAFLMALLPSPVKPPYLAYKNNRQDAVPVGDWMLRLVPRVLLPLFEEKLLNNADVRAILEKAPLEPEIPPLERKFTAAKVLTGWGVLDYVDQKYRLASVEVLSSLTPEGLFSSIVKGFEALENVEARLVAIGSNGDGIYFVSQKEVAPPNSTDTYTDYGLRLQITDIEFGTKKQGSTKKVAKQKPRKSQGSPKASPKLQLGKWMRGQVQAKPQENWIASSSKVAVQIEPGLTVNLLRLDHENNASFRFGLELCSVGLDIEGGKGKPLFNTNGYQLQGLESRLYFSWKDGQGTPKFGAAIQLDKMGIPLGPKAGGDSAKSNPVAGNLLGSGDAAKGKEADAVNPTFSAEVAYVDKFHGKVFSEIPSADGKAWIPVSRNFGPLHCRQIGLGFNNEQRKLGVGYDGGVVLGPLNIDLDHLTVDIPLKRPQDVTDYELGLAGLDVSYAGGPISISGGFLKSDVQLKDASNKLILDKNGKVKTTVQYDGMALIKAADFTITGFGSYAVIGHDPSLFIFAVLHKDLGGPAFFHVTGLAAGFGYNRALKLPPIEEVEHFPLVRGALEENYFDGSGPDQSIVGAMKKLQDYIPPSRGEYWFAAGVRFTSFEMMESFALLSVSFGHEVEIGLLGMSKMTVPKGADSGSAVAYAELALRATIKPEEGSIMVEGRLTDESYIFSKDCHLTGGFGFGTWLSGPHAGDFVVTLGGYHPDFKRPNHYPVVPRLGINWRKGDLTITGEEYYALTPSCLMAGGKLSAVYEVSCIKAWFVAYADFLLNWQPFYYRADMGIDMGVKASVRIDVGLFTITLSISVELGVDLHLWGPPFGGEAHVDLTVISFTVPFGDSQEPPKALDAQKFVEACLPLNPGTGQPDVIGVRINNGLLRQVEEKSKKILRVVNAHALSMTAESLIPSTGFPEVALDDAEAKRKIETNLAKKAMDEQPGKVRPDFGIRPMAKASLTSEFTVQLQREISKDTFKDQPTPDNLRISFVENGVPDALWGPSAEGGQVDLPGQPEAKTIQATVGVRFSFAPIKPEHPLFPIPLEKLKFEQLPTKRVVWQNLGEAKTIETHGKNTFWNTIWGKEKRNKIVNTRRDAILDILSGQSPFEMNKPDLERLRRSERDYFQSDPKLCALGEQLK